MNRTVAVSVALALLLAHTLAIHQDASGGFGPPYDRAYVTYHLARNLVYQGHLVWGLGQTGLDAQPSLLWMLVAAIPERLYVSVNVFCQTIGIVAALLTVLVASQFGARRGAGLITALLLAVSGGLAAAAANGLETAIFTLFVATSFTAMGKGWSKTLSACLVLACLTRPEGVLVLLGLFAVRVKHLVVHDERSHEETGLLPFLPPSLAVLALWIGRWVIGADALSPTLSSALGWDAERWSRGLDYLLDFVVACPATLLVVYPAWYVARGRLSGLGRQALALSAGWAAWVVARGGDSLPYYEAMVPCLPLLFLAVQEGMTLALDQGSLAVRRLALALFAAGFFATALVSREAADLGPLPVGELQARWMDGRRAEPYGETALLGQGGLQREIHETVELRAIGLFLREHESVLEAGGALLTPWPGALAYLSGMPVVDLLGRATPVASGATRRPWSAGERADVVAALERLPDFVVAFLDPPRLPHVREIAEHLARRWDAIGPTAERVDALVGALEPYELVAVPIRVHYRGPSPATAITYYLLRRRALGLQPSLSLTVDESARFHVEVRHRGHLQLAHLRVTVVDADGRTWAMRPTGRFEERPGLYARTHLLLYATGVRPIRLVSEGTLEMLPDDVRPVEVRAQLFNPGARGAGAGEDNPFASVSAEAVLRL